MERRVGSFRLRTRRGDGGTVFRAPGHPLLPAVFAVVSAAFLVYSLIDSAASARRFLADPSAPAARAGIYPFVVAVMIAAGVPVSWLMRRRHGSRDSRDSRDSRGSGGSRDGHLRG